MIRRGMRTIAHRFVLSSAATLALAAPASAAEVARSEGAALGASDDADGSLCLRLESSDPLRNGGSSTCGPAPVRALRSMLLTLTGGDRVLAAGAVPAAIVRAEAELADGRRVGFETTAGPRYRGRHAGRGRFSWRLCRSPTGATTTTAAASSPCASSTRRARWPGSQRAIAGARRSAGGRGC